MNEKVQELVEKLALRLDELKAELKEAKK